MKRRHPTCHGCVRLPRSGFDGFCSAECRRAFEHDREIVAESDRETAEGDTIREINHAAWRGGRRVNLQNSA